MGNKGRGTFGSRFGTIAAIVGSVVGLGNIWRFPYVAGVNGGSAFLIVYVCVSLLISIPLMLSEFSVGRSQRSNVKKAFKNITPKPWYIIGFVGVLIAFIIMAFYSVVGGWSFEFLRESVHSGFAGKTANELANNFNSFISSGENAMLFGWVSVLLTSLIVFFGVKNGIERVGKIFIPSLVVILILLAINSILLPSSEKGLNFLFSPDFSKITYKSVIAAVGQSFFSLSIGMGAMITYGSYIREKENLIHTALIVSLIDVCVAIISGIVIFPAVFSYGIEPTAGPQLLFYTMPMVFSKMAYGQAVAILFFLLVFFAAITSMVSLVEVVTNFVMEEFNVSRKIAVIVVCVLICICCGFCTMSLTEKSILVFGGYSLFNWCDMITSNIMMPITGLFIAIFVGWVMPKSIFQEQLTNKGTCNMKLYKIVRFLVRFLLPIILTLLFLNLIGYMFV